MGSGHGFGMKDARGRLRARIGALEGRRGLPRASVDGGEIDGWLGGGLARGRVHAVAGPGATAFVAVLCARLRGPVLWCVVEGGPFSPLHPPGFAALGLDPRRLVMARTDSEAGALGASEAGLREPGLAAVVVETAGGLRSVHGRRLQLAAEAGEGLGFVFPARTCDVSWAESGWETVPVSGGERGLRWRWTLRGCAGRGRASGWWSGTMRRVLCVWFPRLATECLTGSYRDGGRPVAAVVHGGTMVTAVSEAAEAAGVSPAWDGATPVQGVRPCWRVLGTANVKPGR